MASSSGKGTKVPYRCSFCGKSQEQVTRMLGFLRGHPDVLHVETEHAGVMPEALAELERTQYQGNQNIVLITDGIPAAENPALATATASPVHILAVAADQTKPLPLGSPPEPAIESNGTMHGSGLPAEPGAADWNAVYPSDATCPIDARTDLNLQNVIILLDTAEGNNVGSTRLPDNRRADVAATQSALNWQPAVSIDDGMQRTYEWYRELDQGWE